VVLPSSLGPRMVARYRRDRVRWALWCLAAVVAAAGTGWILGRHQAPATGSAVATGTGHPRALTPACAELLRLARRLAGNAEALAAAAHTHAELMDRLDLFLEGKPGGLSGEQVYQLGEAQMRVFEARGPPTHRQAHHLKEVAHRCPPSP
jgi:hypothetical protein